MARIGGGEALTRARAGDVTEVTLARQPVAPLRPERRPAPWQGVAVGVGEQAGGCGRGGKNAFVQAEDKREALNLLWGGLKAGFALDIVDGDTDLAALRNDQDFKDMVRDAKALNAPRLGKN